MGDGQRQALIDESAAGLTSPSSSEFAAMKSFDFPRLPRPRPCDRRECALRSNTLATMTAKTASEVIAEKEARYRDDPAYRAAVDASRASLRARAEQRERNLAPFTEALIQAGISETSDRATGLRHADPRIFNVAFEHLGRPGYDDETRAMIARSFETRGAAPHWDRQPHGRDAATVKGEVSSTLSSATSWTRKQFNNASPGSTAVRDTVVLCRRQEARNEPPSFYWLQSSP